MNDADSECVSDHAEFTLLRDLFLGEQTSNGASNNTDDRKYAAQYRSAFDFLREAMHLCISTTSVSVLAERSYLVDEAARFSAAMNEAYTRAGWSYATAKTSLCYLRKILRETAVNPAFPARISLRAPGRDRAAPRVLPARFDRMPDDRREKQTLLAWIDTMRRKTKNRSVESLKTMAYFLANTVAPALSIPLDADEFRRADVDVEKCASIPLGASDASRLRAFLLFVVGADADTTTRVVAAAVAKSASSASSTASSSVSSAIAKYNGEDASDGDDGSDKHTFTADELDLLYAESTKKLRDELFYLLLITTGMRVGGLVRIRLASVAVIDGEAVTVSTTGKTVEKGNKCFRFMMNARVRELVRAWVSTERRCDSEWLFPTHGGGARHISTAAVRKMIKRLGLAAGVSGAHCHPHSLRHSYAHILLECGNDAATVSRMLGHARVETTQAFYLRENAVDAASRANIPWLDKDAFRKRKTVPDFLVSPAAPRISGEKDPEPSCAPVPDAKRRRGMRGMRAFLAKNTL